jgi:hypothetical protein
MTPPSAAPAAEVSLPARRQWDHWFILVPAFGAVALGALYATGAMLEASELRGAGLKIGTALPVLSLEQILARGISAIVGTALLGLAIAAAGALSYMVASKAEQQAEVSMGVIDEISPLLDQTRDAIERGDMREATRLLDADDPKTSLGRIADLSWWILAPAGIFVILITAAVAITSSPPLTLAILITAFGGVIVRLRYRAMFTVARITALQMTILLLGAVGVAWFYPQPLPRATVSFPDGRSIQGGYIGTTGNEVHIVRGEVVVSFPVSTIARTTFRARHHRNPPSTVSVIERAFR